MHSRILARDKRMAFELMRMKLPAGKFHSDEFESHRDMRKIAVERADCLRRCTCRWTEA